MFPFHPFVKSRKSARQNEITASNIKILLIQTRWQIHILKMKILESEFRIKDISGARKSVELNSPAEPRTPPSISETTRWIGVR